MHNKFKQYDKLLLLFLGIIFIASVVDLTQIIQGDHKPPSGEIISLLGIEMLQDNLSSIMLIITMSIGLVWLYFEGKDSEDFEDKTLLLILFLGVIISTSFQMLDGTVFAIVSDLVAIISIVAVIALLLQSRGYLHSGQ